MTYSKKMYFPSLSHFSDPHGNGYTPPQKLTARLVVVAPSVREKGRKGEEQEEQGRWDLKNQGK